MQSEWSILSAAAVAQMLVVKICYVAGNMSE